MELAPSGGMLEGLTFVVTGKLERYSRSEAEAAIRTLGGRVGGSVSRNTRAVVAGEAAGSKLTRAEAIGVAVIDEEAFGRLLTEGPAVIAAFESEETAD